MIPFINDPSRMAKDQHPMASDILDLTLEIIYLITGEDYTVVRKSSPRLSGWLRRTRSNLNETSLPSLIHEKKILELANKITELLTGEVPIRCQDVTIHFSTEEWEYLEEHKDLYNKVMMKDRQSVTSLDESSIIDPPERCPSPVHTRDCPEKTQNTALDPQESSGETTNELEISTSVSENDEDCSIDLDGDLLLSPYPKEDDGQSQIVIERTGRKAFTSSESEKQLEKNSHLSTHEKIHMDEKSFSCLKCGIHFRQKSSLIDHLRIHTGEKPHSCTECGKCFTQKSAYARHLRTHTGEKPYSCSECGKCFTYKSAFNHHLRSHAGEKPYSCPECGKSYSYKSSLVEHIRTHTGEKPFKCSECGKCFNHKSNLADHLRTHTGEKPFSCTVCGKCFTKKTSLVEHIRIHTGEKPYSCSQCGKYFSQRSVFLAHQKDHFGEKTI